jgi:hypothetical protein
LFKILTNNIKRDGLSQKTISRYCPFNRVYRLGIQSVMLVFSTPLVNYCPSNLFLWLAPKVSRNLSRKWGIGIPQYLYIYGRRIVSRNFLYFLAAQAQTATHVKYNGPLQFSSLLKGHGNETDSSILTSAKPPARKKKKIRFSFVGTPYCRLRGVDFRMLISPRIRSKNCKVLNGCVLCRSSLYEKSVSLSCHCLFKCVCLVIRGGRRQLSFSSLL